MLKILNINKLIIISVIIASILYSKEDRVIISINGLESAGLSKRHINFAHYSIREISIDLEETVSKMIGDKYSINIHFTAYEAVENTINVARDSLNIIIKIPSINVPNIINVLFFINNNGIAIINTHIISAKKTVIPPTILFFDFVLAI